MTYISGIGGRTPRRRGYDAPAWVGSGSRPTPTTTAFRVTLSHGHLRLQPAGTDGVVLDVPVAEVVARPVGRAGSVVVEVGGNPLLVNFGRRRTSGRAGSTGRRLVSLAAVHGAYRRARFLRALSTGSS